MLERFTERARRVIVGATGQARSLRHEFVAPEHVLLSLILDSGGMGTHVLQRLVLDVASLKAEVERTLLAMTPRASPGEPAFDADLRRVFALAVETAGELRHPCIGTEDLLLGLLKAGQSNAARILKDHGASLAEAQREVPILIGAPAPATSDTLRLIRASKWLIKLRRGA